LAIQTTNIQKLYDDMKKDKNIEIANDIQQSEDKKLLQFSLKADDIKYNFKSGETEIIPGYFVELIERIDDREGFDTNNANTIFDSTNKITN